MSTLYISPTGSGNKSGSDWNNAAVITSLNTLIKQAGPGGSVLLLADAGAYAVKSQIDITASFADGAGVTVKGVSRSGANMDAHIEGTRPAVYAVGNPAGNELFKFQAGAANLTFQNLDIANTGTAFRAAGDVRNITIEHVDATNVARFFEDYAGGSNKTATITGLTIRDVEVDGFSKGVIRLQYDTSNVLIDNVRGDSQRQDGADFAIGVHLDGTTHDVMIRNTVMENATDTTNGYWNGDGFATERGVTNVVFQDTVARGNTDAGYDLKSTQTTLIRALADDNTRNFRIWGEAELIDSVGIDPDKRGGSSSQTQVWLAKGAIATITGGYFADAGSDTTVFRNEGGALRLTDTEVVYAASAKLSAGQIAGLLPAEVTKVVATGAHSDGTAASPLPAIAPVVTPAVTPPVAPAAPTPEAAKIVSTATPVVPAAKHLIEVKASTAVNETHTGTAATEHFIFNTKMKMGSDVITSFGHDDLLITTAAIRDGNNDGIITFGSNGLLDLGASAGSLKADGLTSGLRYLGQTVEGFAYGDAKIRPVKALEGKLGVNDSLSGDKGDKAATKFFIDSALGVELGDDKIALFGAKDVLITTAKLTGTAAVGGALAATAGAFSIDDGSHHLGSISLSDIQGKAVNTIEYDGERVVGDAHYFVYSLVGGSAGLAGLGF